jgi:hypothetical protein
MAKQPRENPTKGELVALEPRNEVTVLPPNSGVVGRFLEDTENMFKARAMRMSGIMRRINESGQRTETLLRMAAERMESAELALEQQFKKEGLLPESDEESSVDG